MNLEPFNYALDVVFTWVWQTSVAATVLIALVALAQLIFRRAMPPRWCYALSLLVLIRLALPFVPASHWSIFNLERKVDSKIHDNALPSVPASGDGRVGALRRPNGPSGRAYLSGPGAMPDATKTAAVVPALESIPQSSRSASENSWPTTIAWHSLAAYLWLAGCSVMLTTVWFRHWRFIAELRRWEPVRDPRALELLDDCRAVSGVRRTIPMVAAEGLNTPALYGVFNPRLLIPAEMLRQLDERQLRHIFLHELTHLRRGDVVVNWAALLLRAVHWFNPFIWMAVRRLRADQELACDAAVLSRLADDEQLRYGGTLVRLLEGFSASGMRPGVVPFVTNKQTIQRRIRMIANFKAGGRTGWAISLALLIVLVWVTFTRAEMPAATQPDLGADGGAPVTNIPVDLRAGRMTITKQPDGRVQQMVFDSNVVIKNGVSELRANRAVFSSASAAVVEAGASNIEVLVGKDGTIRMGTDRKVVTRGELKVALQTLVATNPNAALSVRSTDTTRFEDVVWVLDLANDLKIKRVTLQSAQPPTPEAANDQSPSPPNAATEREIAYRLQAAQNRLTAIAPLIDQDEKKLADIETSIANEGGDSPSVQEAQKDLIAKETLLNRLASLSPADLRQVLPTTVPDPILTELLKEYDERESKLAELNSVMGPNHPDINENKAILKEQDSQIEQRVNGILKGLQIQADADRDLISRLQKEIYGAHDKDLNERRNQVTAQLDQMKDEQSALRREVQMLQSGMTSGDLDQSFYPASPAAGTGFLYTVKPNDTLVSIAKKLYSERQIKVTPNDILLANPSLGNDVKNFKAGQTLLIPEPKTGYSAQGQ